MHRKKEGAIVKDRCQGGGEFTGRPGPKSSRGKGEEEEIHSTDNNQGGSTVGRTRCMVFFTSEAETSTYAKT